uniref:Uncharacterized protein n=1 Tax=Oryza rufipogon TaxID=4529 RepID=A0A0E0PNZ5_ORYRU
MEKTLWCPRAALTRRLRGETLAVAAPLPSSLLRRRQFRATRWDGGGGAISLGSISPRRRHGDNGGWAARSRRRDGEVALTAWWWGSLRRRQRCGRAPRGSGDGVASSDRPARSGRGDDGGAAVGLCAAGDRLGRCRRLRALAGGLQLPRGFVGDDGIGSAAARPVGRRSAPRRRLPRGPGRGQQACCGFCRLRGRRIHPLVPLDPVLPFFSGCSSAGFLGVRWSLVELQVIGC